MATKTKDQNELQQEKINQTVSKTEQLYNENKAAFWGVIIGVIALGLIILAYQQFIAKPKMAEAQEQMYPAEAAFRAGNFEAALNGDGNVLGFAEVIDQYGAQADLLAAGGLNDDVVALFDGDAGGAEPIILCDVA